VREFYDAFEDTAGIDGRPASSRSRRKRREDLAYLNGLKTP